MSREPYRLTFALGDMRGAANLRGQQLEVLLRALVQTNVLRLQRQPALRRSPPPRFEPHPTGRRPAGEEEWLDAATAFLLGAGDSVDLACFRAAQLRLSGVDARVVPLVSGDGSTWSPSLQASGPAGQQEVSLAGLPVGRLAGRPLTAWMRITFVLDLFNGSRDEALAHATLDVLLDALTEIDRNYLLAHPETPPLYSLRDKLLYMEEPPGQEDWQDVPTCLRMRTLDCEDAACWRTAEAQIRQGLSARASFSKHETIGGATLYHITTVAGGRKEDPSRFFGMR